MKNDAKDGGARGRRRSERAMGTEGRDWNREIGEKKRILLDELRERSLWFVRLRWWVPPVVLLSSVVAWAAGFSFGMKGLVATAVFVLAYNVFFYGWSRRIQQGGEDGVRRLQPFAYWQTGMDVLAMFLMIHFTGGVQSPLIFFLIFHIIFASILLPPRSAYGFSCLVVGGMLLIGLGEYAGWSPHHPLVIHGTAVRLAEKPFLTGVVLLFFAASVFITAFSTTSITKVLRRRIVDLGELSEAVTVLNEKLRALFSIIQAIGSAQRLDHVLSVVTNELQAVMNVRGISVKLLSEDGRFLRFAAARGLPESLVGGEPIEVARSLLNRRILDGEPYVTGNLTERELFQFSEALEEALIRSVLFVPLVAEGRVIGILGAYCHRPERFDAEDVRFLSLAGDLVAITLENARAFESVEALMKERSWYVMRVAHNLKSPLATVLNIMEVILGGYLGDVEPRQKELLQRLDERARGMHAMINELMILTARRSGKVPLDVGPVDLCSLAGKLRGTFQEEAESRGIDFAVQVPDDLPRIEGDGGMLKQVLENLVSNALRYTPDQGKVHVNFSVSVYQVRIEVFDTGIGISKDDLPHIFKEFYRAERAREVRKNGTGLGMAIVREIVDRHGGRIVVESEEGLGTLVVVQLPIYRSGNSKAAGKEQKAGAGSPETEVVVDRRERVGTYQRSMRFAWKA